MKDNPCEPTTPPSDSDGSGRFFFDDDDPWLDFEESEACSKSEQRVHTRGGGRGKHKRSADMGKRTGWLAQVKEHMKLVNSAGILGINACSKRCDHKACNELIDLRVAKLCASDSFGEGVLRGDWSNLRRNHDATKHWFEMAHAHRVVDQTGKVTRVDYKVHGIPVCQGAWASLHGIKKTTAASIHRQVMNNVECWSTGLAKQAMLATRMQRAHLSNAAAAWWYVRLGYYEIVVDMGYIQCPRDICWSAVYEEEFVPEMLHLGYNWKTPYQRVGTHGHDDNPSSEHWDFFDPDVDSNAQKQEGEEEEIGCTRGSIATWYRGRAMALQRWAHERIGMNCPAFKLVSRAKHSAYVRCSFKNLTTNALRPPISPVAHPCLSRKSALSAKKSG